MNNKKLFLLLFVLLLCYYFMQKKYDITIILGIIIMYTLLYDNDNENFGDITEEDKEFINKLITHGTLEANYLTVNNSANICGITMSNGSINVPGYTNIGGTEFSNGSLSTQQINIQQ